jgi:hypothetical protein
MQGNSGIGKPTRKKVPSRNLIFRPLRGGPYSGKDDFKIIAFADREAHNKNMKRIMASFALPGLFICLLASPWKSCGSMTGAEGRTAAPSGGGSAIYIIEEGYHSGIIISREILAMHGSVLAGETAPWDWCDIGWGDRDFYTGKSDGCRGGFNALFLSSTSVVHVKCFRSLEDYWRRGSFVLKINLTGSQTALLCRYIDRSLKTVSGKPVAVSRNFMSGGAFYESGLRYHAFNTCNTWIAGALKDSGLDVSLFMLCTAGSLKSRIRKLGTVVYESGD